MFGKVKKLKSEIERLKERNSDLKAELKCKEKYIEQVNKEVNDKNEKIQNLEKENEKVKKERDAVVWENDILYQYYDLKKDPTQEQKTAVRINKRVHELEMENVELRQQLRNILDAQLRKAQLEMSYGSPLLNCQSYVNYQIDRMNYYNGIAQRYI